MTLLRTFERRKVDGVMMTISDEAHSGVLSALGAAKMPVLLIDPTHRNDGSGDRRPPARRQIGRQTICSASAIAG